MREIALDTETTGLDPFSGHRIVEIGCVEMVHKIRTGKFFHAYLNPERDVPAEAERVHGLSAEFLEGKPKFAEKVEEFLAFVGDAPLVIHNAGFDMKFINFELERVGKKSFPMQRAVDTLAITRRKFPGAPASLDALCKRFGVDVSARSFHGALLDAELLAEVYVELCGGRQVGLSLGAQDLSLKQAEAAETVRVSIPHREFPVSEKELQAHAALVARLRNALWTRDAA